MSIVRQANYVQGSNDSVSVNPGWHLIAFNKETGDHQHLGFTQDPDAARAWRDSGVLPEQDLANDAAGLRAVPAIG